MVTGVLFAINLVALIVSVNELGPLHKKQKEFRTEIDAISDAIGELNNIPGKNSRDKFVKTIDNQIRGLIDRIRSARNAGYIKGAISLGLGFITYCIVPELKVAKLVYIGLYGIATANVVVGGKLIFDSFNYNELITQAESLIIAAEA